MLIGNVGKEPEVKYIDHGVCVASVTLATTERAYKLKDGTEVPERTEWHNIVLWRGLAEVVEKYVHKGDRLYVEGKIQSRDWTDRQGIARKSIDIVVDNMELLSPKPAGAAQLTAPEQPAAPAAPAPAETNGDYPF